jgi:hypothetical protein
MFTSLPARYLCRKTIQVFKGKLEMVLCNVLLMLIFPWIFAGSRVMVRPVNKVATPLSSILQTGVLHVALACH